MKNSEELRGGHQDQNDAVSAGFSFERPDWVLFRSLESLTQKAGVDRTLLPALVLKELVDNALDAGGKCRYGRLGSRGVFVHDDGPGIPGSDDDIAALFSIKRPLVSSKLLRRPTRGALGNGLRVVAGVVLASAGRLIVRTRARSLELVPQDDGETRALQLGPWNGKGTRVEVRFGEDFDLDEDDLFIWARRDRHVATGGTIYLGPSSPWWYDSESFYELLQASRDRSVLDTIKKMKGCTGSKGKRIAGVHANCSPHDVTRGDADSILARARREARPVKAIHLGKIGPDGIRAYARSQGTLTVQPGRGGISAEVPYTAEAWVNKSEDLELAVYVNRTPPTGEMNFWRSAANPHELRVLGCGLNLSLQPRSKSAFDVTLHIITPYMPITTDGKEPDLGRFSRAVKDAISGAIRRAKRRPGSQVRPPESKKAVICRLLPAAIAEARGPNKRPTNLRTVYYKLRPEFQKVFGAGSLDYNYFSTISAEIESKDPKLFEGVLKDDRGTLYLPHISEHIPLGPKFVSSYKRDDWLFNKIIYVEKEGLFPVLIEDGWPERNDCALVTSKGFASRAARDLLALLGNSGEEVQFFCIHDADGYGTKIHEALERGAPGLRITNLGLEADEGRKMGLEVEEVESKTKVPVAKYVNDEDRVWYQTQRIELNAMTTDQFTEWLDAKMSKFGCGKVIPPQDVIDDRLARDVRTHLRKRLVEEILRNARLDEREETEFVKLKSKVQTRCNSIKLKIRKALVKEPERSWADVVGQMAETLVSKTVTR